MKRQTSKRKQSLQKALKNRWLDGKTSNQQTIELSNSDLSHSITEEEVQVAEFNDPIHVAFATLCCGLTFANIQEFLALMGHTTISSTSFFEAQKRLSVEIEKLLQKKLASLQERIIIDKRQNGTKFTPCFDGAYSHPRKADECVVDIIHPDMRNIFDFCINEKKDGKHLNSDYNDSSKSMEITGLKSLFMKWIPYYLFNGHCHDLDSSARSLIENVSLHLKEYSVLTECVFLMIP